MFSHIINDRDISENVETLGKFADLEPVVVIIEIRVDNVNADINAHDREELFADLAD